MIVQLLDRFLYGGAEKVALTYATALAEAGTEPSVVWALKENRAAVRGLRLYANHFDLLRALLSAAWRQPRLVLFCHTSRALFVAALVKLCAPRKVKVVYVRHFRYGRHIRHYLRGMRVFVDAAISINPAVRADAASIFHDRIVDVTNFTMPSAQPSPASVALVADIRARASGRCVICFLGAVKPGKNAEQLLELAGQLDTQRFFFLYIGDGPGMPAVVETARRLQIPESGVFYAGYQDDPVGVLQAADYLFFPSWNDYEMTPMVILEAMQAGLKVLGYDLMVTRTLLPAANLFAPRDYPEIERALVADQIAYVPNRYDFEYGKDKLRELVSIRLTRG